MDLLVFFPIHQLVLSICLVVQCQVVGNTHTNVGYSGIYTVANADVPYLAWVAKQKEYNENFGNGRVCAGTLTSQSAILSAAQCYYVKSSYPVRYKDADLYIAITGESRFGNPDRLTHEFSIQQIVGHSDFNEKTMDNNVAVLFISGYIPRVWKNVKPLPLAESPPEIGETCFLSGWVKGNQDTTESQESSLQCTNIYQAELSILDSQSCRDSFPAIGNSTMCTGFKKQFGGTCFAVAGNPLVCSKKLTGILTMDQYCFETAATFTNISKYIDWIREVNSTFDYSVNLDLHSLSSKIRNYQQLALFLALLILIIYEL